MKIVFLVNHIHNYIEFELKKKSASNGLRFYAKFMFLETKLYMTHVLISGGGKLTIKMSQIISEGWSL